MEREEKTTRICIHAASCYPSYGLLEGADRGVDVPEASHQVPYWVFHSWAPFVFALDIKPRGMVLEPIIPEKGLVMLYATRGTGKTHVALGVANAVATGSTFLKWRGESSVRRRRLLSGMRQTFHRQKGVPGRRSVNGFPI
jgi:hypothetical protein